MTILAYMLGVDLKADEAPLLITSSVLTTLP